MTIPKERFTAICYEAADAINEDGYGYIFKQDAEAFGLALIKRVEAEQEVCVLKGGGLVPCIALPLVSEE